MACFLLIYKLIVPMWSMCCDSGKKMSNRNSESKDRSLLVVAPPPARKDSFRSAYMSGNYRMYAPFLTQLSTQYDPVEIQNAQRQDRRKQAKAIYERDNRETMFQEEKYIRRDIKI